MRPRERFRRDLGIMVTNAVNLYRRSAPLALLGAFFVLLCLTGGSSQQNVAVLVVLRPTAAMLCGLACLMVDPAALRANRVSLWFVAAVVIAVGYQLVPLPPGFWTAAPGRALVVRTDALVGLGAVWRPLSLVPWASWNALAALLVPLAVLLLVIQLSPRHRIYLAYVVAAMGLADAVVGMLQPLGSADSPLYLFPDPSGGSTGFFANRNHHAVLLDSLVVLVAAIGATRTGSSARMVTVVAILLLVALVLITGSRAGLALLLPAVGAAVLILNPGILRKSGRAPGARLTTFALAFAAISAISTVVFLSSRAESLNRILASSSGDDLRFVVWRPIVDMARYYLPIGSGAGTFAEVYQIHEPGSLLNLEYLNHAHNDWLEVLMTMGLVGGALLLWAVGAWARLSLRVWSSAADGADPTVVMARAGSAILLLIAMASLVDYPARTPLIAALLAIGALWLSLGERAVPKAFAARFAASEPAVRRLT